MEDALVARLKSGTVSALILFDLDHARKTAEILRNGVEEPSVEHECKCYRVTLSLGGAVLHKGDDRIDPPMQRADNARIMRAIRPRREGGISLSSMWTQDLLLLDKIYLKSIN